MAADPDPGILSAVFEAIGPARGRKPVMLGICGAQASGKSTLAQAVERRAAGQGVAAASLSLDDLYRTRAERLALGEQVHPLFRTRGVPGTHDVALGLEVFDALDRGEAAMLPRFDKASDDRAPREQWNRAPADCELLVFEGWCVGARPETKESLRQPVNDLEALEDPDAIWRCRANEALAGPYQALFARIDVLVLLEAPDFSVVHDWRLQQEAELRARSGPDAPGLMDANEIARFIAHYERLTRHILAEMPSRADLVVRLAADRSVLAITRNAAASR